MEIVTAVCMNPKIPFAYSRTDEPMAHDIHCCPKACLFLLLHLRLYTVQNMCVCVYVCMYICVCVCIYMCVCVYICVCICICVCVYIHIYIYVCTHTHTHKLYMNYRETFLHRSERCKVLTGYLSLGRRSGGDWTNT